jgi:hypothetical protein
MFSENDLSFATERLKDLQTEAEQVRRAVRRTQTKLSSNPLWVRVLNTVLDRSRWTLVQKSAFEGGATYPSHVEPCSGL